MISNFEKLFASPAEFMKAIPNIDRIGKQCWFHKEDVAFLDLNRGGKNGHGQANFFGLSDLFLTVLSGLLTGRRFARLSCRFSFRDRRRLHRVPACRLRVRRCGPLARFRRALVRAENGPVANFLYVKKSSYRQ